MSTEAAPILELAERLAREAGRIQREHYEGEFEIHTKSAVIDLVTDVDRACERLIVEAIQTERPETQFSPKRVAEPTIPTPSGAG